MARPEAGLDDRCAGRLAWPLHAFAWSEACTKAGLERDALYLLRPDSYVALAELSGEAASLDRYFTDRGLTP